MIVPRPAAPQNSTCQSACCATSADSGMPSAPPMPSEELIRPRAAPSRAGGRTSRIMLIPSGTTPDAMPCIARPETTGSRLLVIAHSSEPAISSTWLASSRRFLPYMSPSRPAIGGATAEPSRVAVTVHAVFDADECNSLGRSGISGIMSVYIREATVPVQASVAMIGPTAGSPGRGPLWWTDTCVKEASLSWRGARRRIPRMSESKVIEGDRKVAKAARAVRTGRPGLCPGERARHPRRHRTTPRLVGRAMAGWRRDDARPPDVHATRNMHHAQPWIWSIMKPDRNHPDDRAYRPPTWRRRS